MEKVFNHKSGNEINLKQRRQVSIASIHAEFF